MTTPPAAGDPAPDFTLPSQDGGRVALSSLRGERVVVFFYPQAMTPACTTEAREFQDAEVALRASGIRLLGISRDPVERLARFAERDELRYPLLSDPDAAVHRAYGAYGEKNSYGRLVTGVIRSTVVIDGEGRIEHALRNVRASGHVGRVRALLGV